MSEIEKKEMHVDEHEDVDEEDDPVSLLYPLDRSSVLSSCKRMPVVEGD